MLSVQETMGLAVIRAKPMTRWVRRRSERPGKGVRGIFLALLLFLCPATRVFAQTADAALNDNSGSEAKPRQYLFGDWGGQRTASATKGVTFDFFYVADLQAN